MFDTTLDPLWRVIETQGIVAGLLLIQMLQNCYERKALLKKNCELNHFIMRILERKIDEDSPLSKPAQACPKHSNFNDLPSEAIITQPAGKVS